MRIIIARHLPSGQFRGDRALRPDAEAYRRLDL